MPILQPFFPSYNRTPKHHSYLNTLHPNPRDEFRTFWGRVEEFLVVGEQMITHTKLFFFPFLSAATCTNHPLEVDQRRKHRWPPTTGWRQPPWTMTKAGVHIDGRLHAEQPAEDYGALFLWPAEGGEVEVPPSSATRGHCTGVITATPWAQSTQSTEESTWSTGDPFIANESPAASAGI
ncbi:hypothetical protein Taro_034006 [Colocasia esculenta]|uniref:Uncharacterized protein n=1 Tax=Colocasia esculenta TaxID=4460 RepID=A0A843VQ69_COLES|nr:hypothetical protein [Colocasia esculenta]